jgi:hypothetical protein
MTTIGGMFGSKNDNVNFVYDSMNNKIQTKSGTLIYKEIGVATMIVSKIKNPDHTSTYGSFKISVLD